LRNFSGRFHPVECKAIVAKKARKPIACSKKIHQHSPPISISRKSLVASRCCRLLIYAKPNAYFHGHFRSSEMRCNSSATICFTSLLI
jgi:hypothetical protein